MGAVRSCVVLGLSLVLLVGVPAASRADAGATTEPATQVSYTTAVLNGEANPTSGDSAYTFQYGTTPAFGKFTPAAAISPGPHQVSATLTKLAPGVTYYFRLVVYSYGSVAYTGNTLTFTTKAVPPGAVATTGSAVEVTTGSANLNGVVNATNQNAYWAFQYGPTTAYGQSTPVQHVGSGLTAVSVTINGLKPGARYHYRLVVAQGSYPPTLANGQDANFTTWGLLKVRGHRVRVRRGRALIHIFCKGGPHGRCKGRISISATDARGTVVPCAGKGFAIRAGRRHTLRPTVRGGCVALLAKARAHRLRATLHAGFAGRQSAFVRTVRLSG